MTHMKILHLNLKKEYFEQIKSGEKRYEYRISEKWLKRLEGKTFSHILIKCGYPKNDDIEKIIKRPWLGYELQTITHPLFGENSVQVCAIRVNE